MTEDEKVAFEKLCEIVSGYAVLTHTLTRTTAGRILDEYQAYSGNYSGKVVTLEDDSPTPMEAVDNLLSKIS